MQITMTGGAAQRRARFELTQDTPLNSPTTAEPILAAVEESVKADTGWIAFGFH